MYILIKLYIENYILPLVLTNNAFLTIFTYVKEKQTNKDLNYD